MLSGRALVVLHSALAFERKPSLLAASIHLQRLWQFVTICEIDLVCYMLLVNLSVKVAAV